jgi:gas vesicle protein
MGLWRENCYAEGGDSQSHDKGANVMDKDGLANFFLGLGIGVGLGILFAPKSGEETRDLLLNKADDGKEYLRQKTAAWKDQASDLVDKGKDVLNRQRDNLADAVEAGKQAYREKVEPNLSTEARS